VTAFTKKPATMTSNLRDHWIGGRTPRSNSPKEDQVHDGLPLGEVCSVALRIQAETIGKWTGSAEAISSRQKPLR